MAEQIINKLAHPRMREEALYSLYEAVPGEKTFRWEIRLRDLTAAQAARALKKEHGYSGAGNSPEELVEAFMATGWAGKYHWGYAPQEGWRIEFQARYMDLEARRFWRSGWLPFEDYEAAKAYYDDPQHTAVELRWASPEHYGKD